MDLKKLSIKELVKLISPNSDVHKELRRRGVLRTKNTTGELGEYFTVDLYNNNPKLPNLFLPDPGVKNIDVLSRDGERYSIKTVTSRKGTTGSFWNPESIENNDKTFDILNSDPQLINQYIETYLISNMKILINGKKVHDCKRGQT